KKRVVVSIVIFFCLVILNWRISPWDQRIFGLFPFRRSDVVHSMSEARARLANKTVLLSSDDPAASILVMQRDVDHARSLYVNGKVDASSAQGDMPTQVLIAQIPMLLHPDPQDVLVIGLAAGVTTGSVFTHHPHNVDTVEIVHSMPQATAYFSDV